MIPEFFKNRDIFITGGSGVVGKAVIETLLRCCAVNKIYILLRPKNDIEVEKRLEKLKSANIFRKLKSLKPNALDDKLIAVPGDVLQPTMGISENHCEILQNVSVIFHCAATVRFDEPLRDALKLNVGGTLEALKFSQMLKNLEIFMYISTFFSNPYLKFVEAKMYESPMNWKFCLDLVERQDFDEQQLDIITKKLIVGFPNTYCFTKNLAESLINDYRGKLPVAIFRPSIVLFATKQPEPGFTTTLNSTIGLFALTGMGLLKSLYLDERLCLDITMIDIGVSVLLYQTIKSVEIYKNQAKSGLPVAQLPVYIFSSCTHADRTLFGYIKLAEELGFYRETAYDKNFLLPGILCTRIRSLYMLVFFLKQFMPAIFGDSILWCMGRKPLLLAAQRRIFHTLEVMQPFMFNNYVSKGITDIEMIKRDLLNTEFTVDEITRGNDYFTNTRWSYDVFMNIRENLLKENPKTLPRAKMIFDIKTWLYRLAVAGFALKLYEIGMPMMWAAWNDWSLQKFLEVNMTQYG